MNSNDIREVITIAIGAVVTIFIVLALFTDFFDKSE